tara:strand:- start:3094 stop:3288 length:195 start_codon:yes stop_codon:yes gene_type:complete
MDLSNNICFYCNKKIKLISFLCKCNEIFCIKHKNPEDHNCKFNYQEFGKKQIKEKNPLIINKKI